MDKNILEFWGQIFLNAARSQQQMENMSKYFEQDGGADNPFMDSFLKMFDWHKPEEIVYEEIIKLTKKSADSYKDFFKAYLTIFDVVSKEEYINLVKENEELKEKITRQEKTIDIYKKLAGKDIIDQEQVVDNLSQIMKNQTQQFQILMKQVNQYYKKSSTTKKK